MTSSSTVPGIFDIAVVGAGIVGLACARAAALRGLRVVVLDRDAQANGASVRNFGFVTVTGQQRGDAWKLAKRSCAIWHDVSEAAGIPILQRGLWLTTRRAEAVPLLEAFLSTEMGEGCELLSRGTARQRCPEAVAVDVEVVLTSSQEIRVDSRRALPTIATWLEEALGVVFLRQTAVFEVEPPRIATSRGWVQAGRVVVCPGDDLTGLYADRIARYDVTRCKLQMLRLADPGYRLPGSMMSDLGLLRYTGYAALPEAAALRDRLGVEQAEHLRHGIHLIAVQDADGSLIVGDSHHYAPTPDPFSKTRVDELILDEFAAATGHPAPRVLERWIGTYSSAPARTLFVDAPAADVRLVMVTSGSGASIGFALGEDVIADLTGGLH